MSNIITPRVFSKARDHANKGNVLAAWQCLADGGDRYARVAHHVLSGEWSVMNCVRAAHWKRVVPQYPIGGEVWTKMSLHALNRYLDFIRSNHEAWCREMDMRDPANRDQMPLPNTDQIVQCYMAAAEKLNLSPACIIHLAGNRLTTPVNETLEPLIHSVAARMGPLGRPLQQVRLPEWESVASAFFGDLDHRIVHNSHIMSPDGLTHNLDVLTSSFVEGLTMYAEGTLGLRPRQVMQHSGSAPAAG